MEESSDNNQILSYSKSVGDLERFMIKSLEWDVLNAYKFMLSIPKASDGLRSKAVLRLAACIIVFYDKIKVTYDEFRKNEKNILEDINIDSNEEDLKSAVQDISKFLIKELKLNHITNKKDYDVNNAEEENFSKGM